MAKFPVSFQVPLQCSVRGAYVCISGSRSSPRARLSPKLLSDAVCSCPVVGLSVIWHCAALVLQVTMPAPPRQAYPARVCGYCSSSTYPYVEFHNLICYYWTTACVARIGTLVSTHSPWRKSHLLLDCKWRQAGRSYSLRCCTHVLRPLLLVGCGVWAGFGHVYYV